MHAVVKGNSAPYPSASPPYTSYPLLSRPVPFIPRDGTGRDGTGFFKGPRDCTIPGHTRFRSRTPPTVTFGLRSSAIFGNLRYRRFYEPSVFGTKDKK